MYQKRKKTITTPSLDFGKVPPHAADLEQAVLGVFMVIPSALNELAPIFDPAHFYEPKNILVATAIKNMLSKEQPVDLLTVVDQLTRMGELANAGDAYYVSTLTNKVTTEANTHFHYRIIMEKFFRRELIRISYELINNSHDQSKDVFDTFEWIVKALDELDVQSTLGSYQSIGKAIEEVQDIISQADTGHVSFYPIKDPGIDKILQISPSNLLNITGKSGSGKTTKASYMAKQLLKLHPNVAICWYTMEDEKSKLMINLISPDIKLSYDQVHGKNYTLTPDDKAAINNRMQELSSWDVEFVEVPTSMARIKMHFQRFCAKRPGKFCILIVDNIMKLTDNSDYRFKGNRNDIDDHIAMELGNTFASTKNAFSINVWYLHHLTKDQLAKGNLTDGYRPREDQIRGSARLRDICTQGILIHRPGEFIDVVKKYRKTEYEGPVSDLIISEVYKNRNGKTGFYRHFANLTYKIFVPFIA